MEARQDSTMAVKSSDNITKILTKLASNISTTKRECSMSTNPYDTAWVSMVAKPCSELNSSKWLFPQSFAYLLENQSSDGSWSSNKSDLDSLLSTLAALLALLKHQGAPNILGCPYTPDLTIRISRAVFWLETKLRTFDPESCTDNVGFEILVPSLLHLLGEYGVVFELPHIRELLALAEKKMAKFNELAKALYKGVQATALHSLEAFIGKIDFDRLKQCKRNGGMLGSPSSTAAYLIYVSDWDDEAELFLKDAVDLGQGKGSGGVASAHPIELFEMSWVASTVLESGTKLTTEDQAAMDLIGGHLQLQLATSKGVIGFSHDLLPDADDTAKCIYALQMLGQDPDVRPMIDRFQTQAVFKTYGDERTPSLTTNCNVLKALLASARAEQNTSSILIAVEFICQCWFSGKVTDKWNVANEYAYMLVAQGLTKLLAREDIFNSLTDLLKFKVPIVLSQILATLLRAQTSEGSWGNGSHEVTAYSVLTLISLHHIPFLNDLSDEIDSAITLGRKYLVKLNGAWEPEPIWIEKVRYCSPILTGVYCISALTAPIPQAPSVNPQSSRSTDQMLHLFRMLPLFSGLSNPQLVLKSALTEAQLFLPYLKTTRLDIFPRPKDLGEEKYMKIIPFSWTACNALRSTPLPTDILIEMMSISMLNFQADEYFELITSKSKSPALRWFVDEACGINTRFQTDNSTHRELTSEFDIDTLTPPDSEDHPASMWSSAKITSVLTKYANRILQHPAVTSASESTRLDIRHKLAGYLQAQITSAINRSSDTLARTDQKSLFGWVRTFGADDTSCPYSFAFYMALSRWVLAQNLKDNPSRDYILNALCANLATMCRMYNDYGSLVRDREEGNLNCVDFLVNDLHNLSSQYETVTNGKRTRSQEETFEESTKRPKMKSGGLNGTTIRANGLGDDAKAKQNLMGLADFERQCMELALAKLKGFGLKGKTLEALLLFIDVTDLFGQIYVVRDIGTKIK